MGKAAWKSSTGSQNDFLDCECPWIANGAVVMRGDQKRSVTDKCGNY
jgi:hypothetical protein